MVISSDHQMFPVLPPGMGARLYFSALLKLGMAYDLLWPMKSEK